MGLFDIFGKKKGLSPKQNVPPSFQGINGAVLQQYNQESYVMDGYLGNADVYAIVSFLARKSASIPWYVYRLNNGEKARTSLMRYKQLSRGLQAGQGAYEQAILAR